jgi:hypothetical protein
MKEPRDANFAVDNLIENEMLFDWQTAAVFKPVFARLACVRLRLQ